MWFMFEEITELMSPWNVAAAFVGMSAAVVLLFFYRREREHAHTPEAAGESPLEAGPPLDDAVNEPELDAQVPPEPVSAFKTYTRVSQNPDMLVRPPRQDGGEPSGQDGAGW